MGTLWIEAPYRAIAASFVAGAESGTCSPEFGHSIGSQVGPDSHGVSLGGPLDSGHRVHRITRHGSGGVALVNVCETVQK